MVRCAREARIDLIAITDHQRFDACEHVAKAASQEGRPLTVLPGIEVTAHEGVHLLAIFSQEYSSDKMQGFLGWLEIDNPGNTNAPSKQLVDAILRKVEEEGGIVVVPHPFTQGIGLLDKARKIGTRQDWLDSGRIHLIQIAADKVMHVERDGDHSWVNRFVLASCQPEHIKASTYCLAPFNVSEVKRPEDIDSGCSWFRMAEARVDGLKQVACEPGTRILRTEPAPDKHPCIVALHVSGGYCDGQFVRFNTRMTCIIGQNYAGKSAIFDLIRFALEYDLDGLREAREELLERLYGILGSGNSVELFVWQDRHYYAIRRKFVAELDTVTGRVRSCTERRTVHRYSEQSDELVPEAEFSFRAEVYEQGRIHRLRDDIGRQLEMLDEFAELASIKTDRSAIIGKLNESADELAPLYEEREELQSAVGGLDQLKGQLNELEEAIPGAEEIRWKVATGIVKSIEDRIRDIAAGAKAIPDPGGRTIALLRNDCERLFLQTPVELPASEHAESETLKRWAEALRASVEQIAQARSSIAAAVKGLVSASEELRGKWKSAQSARQEVVQRELKKKGIESPQEYTTQVEDLRAKVQDIETIKLPRLQVLEPEIAGGEQARSTLLCELTRINKDISRRRTEKAQELSEALSGQIRVDVDPSSDRTQYLQVLTGLCDQIKSRDCKILSRDAQLGFIVSKIDPVVLGESLRAKGELKSADGSSTTLVSACGITENTQAVLCQIATDIRRVNQLQTVEVPDGLGIMVRRGGETEFAELRSGLSPGEQSAAILTLALQTRAVPLIVDQPEDELGYSYVVHLIVPKMLKAKASRQLLIITHNANIPVLGDADYVIQMENRPRAEGGRVCVSAQAGCFESSATTNALIALEGGKQAFQFRQHRYSLPRPRLTLPYAGEVR